MTKDKKEFLIKGQKTLFDFHSPVKAKFENAYYLGSGFTTYINGKRNRGNDLLYFYKIINLEVDNKVPKTRNPIIEDLLKISTKHAMQSNEDVHITVTQKTITVSIS